MSLNQAIAWLLISGLLGALALYGWHASRSLRAFHRSRRRFYRARSKAARREANGPPVCFQPD